MSLPRELSQALLPLRDRKHLLAVSGGLDSMALLKLYEKWQATFGVSFGVAHFHHGESSDHFQNDFRFNAYALVKKLCEEKSIPFYSNLTRGQPQLSGPIKNEAEARRQRYAFLEEALKTQGYGLLVLAHHRDDLLETRLIRLIRGTGPKGLKSMGKLFGHRFRPLLNTPRSDLKEFLMPDGRWIEDPSNEQLDPLRNWLRKKWLPELEDKHPGALGSLARSLDLLVRNASKVSFDHCYDGNSLLLAELWCLSLDQRRQVMASYMKGQGLKNYGLSHINEALKRLDTDRKSLTFRLLGRRWIVDAGRMSVEPAPQFEPSHQE